MEHSQSDLERLGIFQWESIADAFEDANLFLGNGFSISLCNRLSYRSLFKEFINSRDDDLKAIFKAFGTSNFEHIIQILNNAAYVNSLLGKESSFIDPIIANLRNGLIQTIQENHPAHGEIYYPQLSALAYELIEFKDIFTTNYDVFLYKTILQRYGG